MLTLVAHPSRNLDNTAQTLGFILTCARRGRSRLTDAICALVFTLVRDGSASVRHKVEVCVYLCGSYNNLLFVHLNFSKSVSLLLWGRLEIYNF